MEIEPSDVLAEGDLEELRDVTDRVMTEQLLRDPSRWRLAVLPVKRREPGGEPELGYVRALGGTTIPVVEAGASVGVVRSRRYVSVEQLLDAGWRVD